MTRAPHRRYSPPPLAGEVAALLCGGLGSLSRWFVSAF
jgi:hypothetical protein